ncbi:MAG: hypothetical protein P8Z75_00700 [Gammaproteobacteria bacterium]|jgi:hypothetical protein
MKKVNSALERLANAIKPYDEAASKALLSAKKYGPQQIASDLTSWAGAGLLMDRTFDGERGDAGRAFETVSIELAHALIEACAKNRRMNNWIHVFEKWAMKKHN